MPENLKSNLLSEFSHGFFLRHGGVSTGSFGSLNCDLKSSDSKSLVLANREIVAKAMGVRPENLITLKQVHSSKVIRIERSMDSNFLEGDAMVTSKVGLCIGVLTADCAPILFAENEARIIGVAHAGWKGSLDSIVENTVIKMIELGAKKNMISAVIGPCIQQKNYEVGAEFLDRFIYKDPKNRDYFIIDDKNKIWFDLPGLILRKLETIGINATTNIQKCTFGSRRDFFSYRRNQKSNLGDCGRMISTIKI